MSFDPKQLDPDAVHIVSRLQRDGYTAYLVGGCVRDLLLGETPKDFDIATSARPDDIKKVFGRRCRLIGRRFKLAHVRAGSQIFEVATFRGRPEEQDVEDDSGFVVRANVYGDPEEDALSRDFTINGLFYDPIARTIHDHVQGRADVDARLIRTIGDAEKRFREDPVRLLRAVKFAGRLGLRIHDDIVATTETAAELVNDCPAARVTEELMRLTETGHARRTVEVARELGIIPAVVPELAQCMNGDEGRWSDWLDWLGGMDRVVGAHGVLPRESTFTLLTWPLVRPVIEAQEDVPGSDWGALALGAVEPAALRLTVPIRHRQCLRATANVLRQMLHPRRRKRRVNLVRSPAFPIALTVLRMEFLLTGAHEEAYEIWARDGRNMAVSAAPIAPRIDETRLAAAPSRTSGRRRSGARGRTRG